MVILRAQRRSRRWPKLEGTPVYLYVVLGRDGADRVLSQQENGQT